MDELEDYSYTQGRAIEEGSMRICVICHDQITETELRKGAASWLQADAVPGLRFSVHSSCLAEVEQAIDDQRKQQEEAHEAAQFVRDIARTAQQAVKKHR